MALLAIIFLSWLGLDVALVAAWVFVRRLEARRLARAATRDVVLSEFGDSPAPVIRLSVKRAQLRQP